MLSAVNRQAEAGGLRAGIRLADARALLPRLAAAAAEPAADRRGLALLALWCNRFTPCCAVDGDDGLLLDITGADHLFGGEAAMAAEVEARLAGLGFEARTGLADTPGAAWALARFGGQGRRIAAPGGAPAALETLPVEALRIAPEDAHLLRRLGLTTIGAVNAMPRPSLARRFDRRERGVSVPERLDRALGRSADPVASMPAPPICLERMAFPEPLIALDGLQTALARLAEGLCIALERDALGARDVLLRCYRVDGGTAERRISTARATRDSAHLLRLFAGRLETVDPGFGIDAMTLHAARAEPLPHEQLSLAGGGRASGAVGLLIDRLQARLGEGAVCRLAPVESHLPEQAERRTAPGRKAAAWPGRPGLPQRPFRLFDRPEPVEAVAELPDGPPALFVWRRVRRRTARAEGPERIEPEWWAGGGEPRDYYRVEDTQGRRYWLYRAGLYRDAGRAEPPRWYVHGLYG